MSGGESVDNSEEERSTTPADQVQRLIKDHGTLVLAVASGLAYAFARLTLALFSRPLGISVSDLSLGAEEHVTMAAFWFVAFGFHFFGWEAAQRFNEPVKPHRDARGANAAARLLGVLAFMVVSMSAFAISPGRGWVFVGLMGAQLAVGALLGLGWWVLNGQPTSKLWLWSGVPIVLIVGGCYFAWDAGSVLAEGDIDTTRIPLPIALVLGASNGFIELEEECVARLAANVFVTRNGETIVFEQAPTFRTGDCDQ